MNIYLITYICTVFSKYVVILEANVTTQNMQKLFSIGCSQCPDVFESYRKIENSDISDAITRWKTTFSS